MNYDVGWKRYNIKLVESDLREISPQLLKRKEEILKLYESQKKVVKNLSHMNKYEMWEKYNGE